jgi:hypothetical protein
MLTKYFPLSSCLATRLELDVLYMSNKGRAVDGVLVEKLVEHSVVKTNTVAPD